MKRTRTSETAAAAPSAAWPDDASIRGLPAPARAALLGLGVTRRWRTGQTLMWSGERAASVFIVARGSIRMRTFGPDGDERILGWLQAGMLGALASVLGDVPIPCDFIADGPCVIVHVDGQRLCGLLERDAATSLALARMLSVRLTHFMDLHMVQAFTPLADRVWATLRRLATWTGPRIAGRRTGRLEITQAELAQAVGASRYRVGEELHRLRDAGRVRMARGYIEIVDGR